jgi:hypothetical protein
MRTNVFLDKAVVPDVQKLAKALGETYKYWTDIESYVAVKHPGVNLEWKNYGEKHGWSLKTLLKKRNLFFCSAYDNYFRVVFVFGDKAVAAVEQSDLPLNIVEELRSAKKYMEGRGIAIEVKNPKDVVNIKKLIEIKIKN